MKEAGSYNIAILLACYNRRQKTLAFLQSLTAPAFFGTLQADIYLLDDASTDGLAEAVAETFPFVNIIKGDGSLFWAGGMRRAWKHAMEQKAYDIFLLFNDDVQLGPDALERLIATYQTKEAERVILVGSTLSPVSNQISYGGHCLYNLKHAAHYILIPDEHETKACQLGNANVMLVNAETVKRIGIFADVYIHAVADYDYTLTAYKAGVDVSIAPGYYGYCEDDHGVNWLSGKYSLKERVKYLYSPKGLAYKEYLLYIKKHFPLDYFGAFAKLWLKTFFPIFWDVFKEKK